MAQGQKSGIIWSLIFFAILSPSMIVSTMAAENVTGHPLRSVTTCCGTSTFSIHNVVQDFDLPNPPTDLQIEEGTSPHFLINETFSNPPTSFTAVQTNDGKLQTFNFTFDQNGSRIDYNSMEIKIPYFNGTFLALESRSSEFDLIPGLPWNVQKSMNYHLYRTVNIPTNKTKTITAHVDWLTLTLPFTAVGKARSVFYGGSQITFLYSNGSCSHGQRSCDPACIEPRTCICCSISFGPSTISDTNIPAGATRDFLQLKGMDADYVGVDGKADALFRLTGMFTGYYELRANTWNETIADYVPPEGRQI